VSGAKVACVWCGFCGFCGLCVWGVRSYVPCRVWRACHGVRAVMLVQCAVVVAVSGVVRACGTCVCMLRWSVRCAVRGLWACDGLGDARHEHVNRAVFWCVLLRRGLFGYQCSGASVCGWKCFLFARAGCSWVSSKRQCVVVHVVVCSCSAVRLRVCVFHVRQCVALCCCVLQCEVYAAQRCAATVGGSGSRADAQEVANRQ
jgi:hypothetical protein